MLSFNKLTLARQYMLVSLFVMLAGMVVIGIWISQEIETAVTNRTAAVTALYVDSYISPHLQSLKENDQLTPDEIAALERLLSDTSLGQQIVSFKIWSPDGVILYSPNRELIGQKFEVEGELAEAMWGQVVTEVSDLSKPEQAYERQFWDSLIETYAPSWASGSDEILAVSEFYQTTDTLAAEIRTAQLRSWLLVGAVMLVVYLLLAGLVERASRTIVRQQSQLEENVAQLHTLLAQNQQLHGRIRRAASRTTAINEQNLRRISADLHDGPAQDLALALLRFQPLKDEILTTNPAVKPDFETIEKAMESAMHELRTISAGLRLPEIQAIPLLEAVQRAVHDYEQKTGAEAVVTLGDSLPDDVPLPVKITMYRIMKEAMANSYKHAEGQGLAVYVYATEDELVVEISDSGPGFVPGAAGGNGRLGLTGMRERVELLGGQFDILTKPEIGTLIRAKLPLQLPEEEDE
jgi:signal transduction histidine kinase